MNRVDPLLLTRRPRAARALLVCSLVAGFLTVAFARAEAPAAASGPVVVHNAYWAKPGLEEAVYLHRLHANEVRARVGLPTGRVLRRVGGDDTLHDVVWECEYRSQAAREADVEALVASGVFEPVMERMETLIVRFERSMWQATESEGE
jgi:class 3 adenylate cyclase